MLNKRDMAEIKISELEPTTDLEGLYTIGSDKNNLSKKVSLQFLREAADYAIEQGDYAKQEGSTIESRITDFKAETDVKLTELESEVYPLEDRFINKPTITEISGKYISDKGAIRDSESFAHTSIIELPPHYTIYANCRGYLTNVCIIAKYDDVEGTYTPLVNSVDSTLRVYQYTNITNETIKIVCSFSINAIRNINLLDNNIIPPLSYPYDLGVNNTIKSDIATGLVTSSAISWKVSDFSGGIEKKCVEITLTNPRETNWGYYWTKDLGNQPIGKYCAFIKVKQQSTSPIWLIVFTQGGSILARREITNEITSDYQIFTIDFSLSAEKNVMIGVTSGQDVYSKIVIGDVVNLSLIGLAKGRTEQTLISDLYTLEDYRDAISNASVGNVEEIATMAIFEGIPVMGIIGDSLSSGVTHDGTGMITDYKYAWWRVLERDSGQTYIPFAKGGLTTRSWISTYLSEALKPENKCCAYIIGLQVNDAYSLGDSYLGSPSDINMSDYNNNADTYYGNYAKIIQALTANNPKCKFFLFTEPRKTGEKDSNWNGAVRYIANLFDNCYLVDLQEMYNNLYLNGFIKDTIGPQSHYPSIAYTYMGKLIEKAIGETIKANAGDFKYIQFAIV